MLKNQKGITLVALVITIIVLLILAAVAIGFAVDSNGLFNKANEAATEWDKSVKNEQDTITNLMQKINALEATP